MWPDGPWDRSTTTTALPAGSASFVVMPPSPTLHTPTTAAPSLAPLSFRKHDTSMANDVVRRDDGPVPAPLLSPPPRTTSANSESTHRATTTAAAPPAPSAPTDAAANDADSDDSASSSPHCVCRDRTQLVGPLVLTSTSDTGSSHSLPRPQPPPLPSPPLPSTENTKPCEPLPAYCPMPTKGRLASHATSWARQPVAPTATAVSTSPASAGHASTLHEAL